MTGGGIGDLNLRGNSTALVEGTSLLKQGVGGIWEVGLWDISKFNMSGGQVHEITLNNNPTATLTGGLIEAVYSYQSATTPHVTLYYSGDLPTVQEIGGFDYLIGQWGNGTDFSIYLHDTGYDAYGDFNFVLVPEPITLALLSLGGLLIRKKK